MQEYCFNFNVILPIPATIFSQPVGEVAGGSFDEVTFDKTDLSLLESSPSRISSGFGLDEKQTQENC